jgi:hypothetical protein
VNKKLLVITILAIIVILFLAGCAAGTNPTVHIPDAAGKSAGFWMGLWHGVISPVTFIISLFKDNVNIYEVYNSGNWYDFGFMFGISIIFGGCAGASSGARKAKKKISE